MLMHNWNNAVFRLRCFLSIFLSDLFSSANKMVIFLCLSFLCLQQPALLAQLKIQKFYEESHEDEEISVFHQLFILLSFSSSPE